MKVRLTLLVLVISTNLFAQDYNSDGHDYNLYAHEHPRKYARAFHVLDDKNIAECKSPQAVAWNFVMSVVNNDYDRMVSLADSSLVSGLDSMMKGEKLTSYKELFTEEYIDDISGMRPILQEGWQLVCDNGEYIDFSDYAVEDYYKKLKGFTIHFDCMKNGEMYSLQLVRKHDATVRVILVYIEDQWKVTGFK